MNSPRYYFRNILGILFYFESMIGTVTYGQFVNVVHLHPTSKGTSTCQGLSDTVTEQWPTHVIIASECISNNTDKENVYLLQLQLVIDQLVRHCAMYSIGLYASKVFGKHLLFKRRIGSDSIAKRKTKSLY